jgi:hypothetical protein
MKRILFYLFLFPVVWLASCADDDSFTTDSKHLLTFSKDTVTLDTLFSNVPSSTYSFFVHNNTDDGIRISSVRLAKGNQTGYRINVDGTYLSASVGYQTSDIELRKGDSIRVFVEITSPRNYLDSAKLVTDKLLFTLESGVQQQVVLNTYSMDAYFMNHEEFKSDTTISSSRPIVVYGGIKVDSGATVTFSPGTKMYFHDGAGIDVFGTLHSAGDVDNPVILRGDRTDRMFDNLPYDRVSGQWAGIHLRSSSFGNQFYNTDIHSSMYGILCDSSDVSKSKLLLYNCIVHNCKGDGILSYHSALDIENCQITNALGDCVSIVGGNVLLLHCTVAQFYPFDANRGVALRFSNHKGKIPYPLDQLRVINSLITGYSDDELMGEKDSSVVFKYRFINCLICTPRNDKDTLFVNTLWESPDSTTSQSKNFKTFNTDDMFYDFRLDSLSRAIGAADSTYKLPFDRLGVKRHGKPDIGCYEYNR